MRSVQHAVLAGSLLGLAVLVPTVQAATITYLGSDTTTGRYWRTTSTAKTPSFDPNGDNVYGSTGYFLNTHVSATDGKDSGTVLQSLPSYVSSSVTTPASPLFTWGGAGVGKINNPTATPQPIDTNQCSWTYGAGSSILNTEYTFFDFTLTDNATFVLGVIQPQAGGMTDTYPTLRVHQTVGGSSDSGFKTLAASATDKLQYNFFQISGSVGDQFRVSGKAGYQAQYYASSVSIQGMTFETVPEPTSLCTLGLIGIGALAFRRQRSSVKP